MTAKHSVIEKLRSRIRFRTRINTAIRATATAVNEYRTKRRSYKCVARDFSELDSPGTIAMGFAGWKPGVGGVRNHIETIARYSTHPVCIFPSSNSMNRTTAASYSDEANLHFDRGDLARSTVIHSHV